jgi:hypothetical protein
MEETLKEMDNKLHYRRKDTTGDGEGLTGEG